MPIANLGMSLKMLEDDVSILISKNRNDIKLSGGMCIDINVLIY